MTRSRSTGATGNTDSQTRYIRRREISEQFGSLHSLRCYLDESLRSQSRYRQRGRQRYHRLRGESSQSKCVNDSKPIASV